MKPYFFVLITIVLGIASSCCHKSEADFTELPAKWIINTDNLQLYEEDWTHKHFIGSMTGSPAKITAVRSEDDGGRPLEFRINGNKPEVNCLTEGDYLLFKIPVSMIEAGSCIEIDAVLITYPESPKYFIAEIFDGGEWTCSERDLIKSVEDPEVKYTFMCSGTGTKHYQYNNIYQTFRLRKAIKNSELKIRFRAVGNLNCEGEPISEDAENGWIGISPQGFIGAYIQNYGTQTPKDTTSILCLGNSFTYYGNTPSLMKEIAWSQGHYFDIIAHMKGGQTFGQHTNLSLSNEAIRTQVYDYALLQDQSMAAANYISNPKEYAYVPEDYMLLCDMIKEYSPECKIILEHTWGYEKDNCRGFNTIENFNSLLKQGNEVISALNGATVSHIGDAFLAVDQNEFESSLYAKDKHHQSFYGAYLKACVNYLTIIGEPFVGETANCGIDPEKAEYLRKTAEKIVLGE